MTEYDADPINETTGTTRDEDFVETIEDNSAEPVVDPRNPELGIDGDSTAGTLDERARAAEEYNRQTGGSLLNNAQADGFEK
ncbi:MAG TPA: hypothetical protein H9987_08360 [Candidatus Luteococcus avicola]|nr:hypothetical protein [Candidatus Luteococcus avicola]